MNVRSGSQADVDSTLRLCPLYFDRQGTRRTYYERFSDLEAMISLVEEPGIDEIESLVGCAEEASAEVASSYEESFSSRQTDGLQSESTLNPNR